MKLLSRFESKPGQHAPHHMRNGMIVLAVFSALIYWMYTSGSVPFWPKGGTVVTAEFATAANVSAGKTPVRVRGVDVGKVESVERLPGGRGVRVKMRLDDANDVALRRDARADILWRTLLGFGFYIQLDPGSDARPLGDRTIPPARTTTQTELDQVLASVNAPSRAGIRAMLRQFDAGFADAAQPGRSLDALGPAMRNVDPGLRGLRGSRPGSLTQTVRDANRLMGVLARNEVQLGDVVGNADATFAVTAARRAQLGAILRDAPSALAETSSTMARLRTTLDTLDPVADDLRPGVRVLDDASRAVRPALRRLRPLLSDARPLLRDLRPALRDLRSASNSGVPLLDGLEPAFKRTNSDIIPGLEYRDDEIGLPLYETIGPTFATVGASSSIFDANGYTQRFNAVSGGARSAGFLPCTPDLQKLTVACGTISKALLAMAGVAGRGSGTPKAAPRSGRITTSLPRSRQPVALPPARAAVPSGALSTQATRAVERVVGALLEEVG